MANKVYETGVACPHCQTTIGCKINAEIKYVQKGRDEDMVMGPRGASNNYSEHVFFYGSKCQGLFRYPPNRPNMAVEILEAHRVMNKAATKPLW